MVNFNPALDFHTYAIEWTPEYVAWFIDNSEVYRQTGDFIKTLTHPQKIMMNVWNPAYINWIGEWNDYVLEITEPKIILLFNGKTILILGISQDGINPLIPGKEITATLFRRMQC